MIVGLGNPGTQYAGTRHNIGFKAVDFTAQEFGIIVSQKMFQSACGSGIYHTTKLFFIKPLTYMNRSGEAVQAARKYYDIDCDDIIVIHDDMDIPFGSIRVKTRGGSAGHRGVASIKEHLKSDGFLRIRAGIGKPPDPVDPADFVLRKFSLDQQKSLHAMLHSIHNCINILLEQGPQAAMNRYHCSQNEAPDIQTDS